MNREGHAPVIWLTGLPSAGKSTIASGLEQRLNEQGVAVAVLDGDLLRQTVCRGLGFSREDRDENVRRLGFLAGVLAGTGTTAIVAAISPYREARARVRASVPTFVEIHVRCSIEVLELRDVKGLYSRARRGEIAHLTGIDDPYEEPLAPELVLDTAEESVPDCVSRIISYLTSRTRGIFAPE
jgi:adenylyl-sulfate kinase